MHAKHRPVIDVCTRVIVKHTPVIDMRTGVIDVCTGVIDVCTGVIDGCMGVIDGCMGVIDGCTGVIDMCTGVIDMSTGVIVMRTGVIVMRMGAIDVCTGVIDGCLGVIVKHTYAIRMYSPAIAVGGASTAGTEPLMLLQVGDKVAYRKEMTRVVGTIAAMEGDLVINVTGMTKAEVGHTCDLWGYRPTGAATLTTARQAPPVALIKAKMTT